MIVAVTGAGGFLGRSVVLSLFERKHTPVAIVRSDDDAEDFAGLGLGVIRRDLAGREACADLFNGVDAVVHCAALVKSFGRWEDFRRVNLELTENVVAAACGARVKKFIHISTTSVYGNERNHYGTDEESGYGQRVVDPYTRSKILADQLVLNVIRDQSLPAVIMRFGTIWGPGDPHLLPFVVGGLRDRRLIIEGDGGNVLAIAYIRNAVEAVMLALEKNIPVGRIYNITDGAKVTSRRFIDDITDILGIKYKLHRMPYPVLYSAAYALERLYLAVNAQSEPPLTRFVARLMKYHAVFDISRAISELEYRPVVTYREALALSIPYIRALYYGQK